MFTVMRDPLLDRLVSGEMAVQEFFLEIPIAFISLIRFFESDSTLSIFFIINQYYEFLKTKPENFFCS